MVADGPVPFHSLRAKASALKACGYMTSTAGGSSIENIKFLDTKAAGAKGIFIFKGTSVNETKRLTLAKNGIAFTSFVVTSWDTDDQGDTRHKACNGPYLPFHAPADDW